MQMFRKRTKRRPEFDEFSEAVDAANRRLWRTVPTLVAELNKRITMLDTAAPDDLPGDSGMRQTTVAASAI